MKTDNQLERDILAELDWDPAINAADIGVHVKEGMVTLSGHVGSFAGKWDAERAVQLVSGVLDVRLPGSSKRDDVVIARTVKNTCRGRSPRRPAPLVCQWKTATSR